MEMFKEVSKNEPNRRSQGKAMKLLAGWLEWLGDHQDHLGLKRESPYKPDQVKKGHFDPIEVLNKSNLILKFKK